MSRAKAGVAGISILEMLRRSMAKKSLGTTSLVSLELNQPLIVDIYPYLQPSVLCLSLVIIYCWVFGPS